MIKLTDEYRESLESYIIGLVNDPKTNPNSFLAYLNGQGEYNVEDKSGSVSQKILTHWNAISLLDPKSTAVAMLVDYVVGNALPFHEYFKGGPNAGPRRRVILNNLSTPSANPSIRENWYYLYHLPANYDKSSSSDVVSGHIELGCMILDTLRKGKSKSQFNESGYSFLFHVNPCHWTPKQIIYLKDFVHSNDRSEFLKRLRKIPIGLWTRGVIDIVNKVYSMAEAKNLGGSRQFRESIEDEMDKVAEHIANKVNIFDAPWARLISEIHFSESIVFDEEAFWKNPAVFRWLAYLRCQDSLTKSEYDILTKSDSRELAKIAPTDVPALLRQVSGISLESDGSPDKHSRDEIKDFYKSKVEDWITNDLSSRDGREITKSERWIILCFYIKGKGYGGCSISLHKAISDFRPGLADQGDLFTWLRNALSNSKDQKVNGSPLQIEDAGLHRHSFGNWEEARVRESGLYQVDVELRVIVEAFLEIPFTKVQERLMQLKLEGYSVDKIRDILDREKLKLQPSEQYVSTNWCRIRQRLRMQCIRNYEELYPPRYGDIFNKLYPPNKKKIDLEKLDRYDLEEAVRRSYDKIIDDITVAVTTVETGVGTATEIKKARFRLSFFPDCVIADIKNKKPPGEFYIQQLYGGMNTAAKNSPIQFVPDFDQVWERVMSFTADNWEELHN